MRARRRSTVALLVLAACGHVTGASAQDKGPARLAIAADTQLDIRVPTEDNVPFRGMANFDQAGGRTNSMLYQGGVAGLVVGVLTHGALESNTQQRERARIQEAADRVIEPYREVLSGFRARDLMERAVKSMSVAGRRNVVEAAAKPGGGPLLEAKGVFFFTPDESAIVLDNEVLIYTTPGGEAVYRNAIRIVSEAKDAENVREHWLANKGENLKLTASDLMARSLDIGVLDASGAFSANAPHKTVRYPEGKAEKIERAQILQASCDRLLLRTLRESLASVPIKKDEHAANDCARSKP